MGVDLKQASIRAILFVIGLELKAMDITLFMVIDTMVIDT